MCFFVIIMSALFELDDYGSEEEEEQHEEDIIPETFDNDIKNLPVECEEVIVGTEGHEIIQTTTISGESNAITDKENSATMYGRETLPEDIVHVRKFDSIEESTATYQSSAPQQPFDTFEEYKYLKLLPPPSTEQPTTHLKQLIDRYETGQTDLSNIVDVRIPLPFSSVVFL